MAESGASVPTERCSRTNVVHDGHRWTAGRWWKRERWCHGVSMPPEPWQAKAYRRAQARLDAVWEMHGKPYTNDKPGDYRDGMFWCASDLTPWPCATARLLLDEDYEPLRLTKRADASADLPQWEQDLLDGPPGYTGEVER